MDPQDSSANKQRKGANLPSPSAHVPQTKKKAKKDKKGGKGVSNKAGIEQPSTDLLNPSQPYPEGAQATPQQQPADPKAVENLTTTANVVTTLPIRLPSRPDAGDAKVRAAKRRRKQLLDAAQVSEQPDTNRRVSIDGDVEGADVLHPADTIAAADDAAAAAAAADDDDDDVAKNVSGTKAVANDAHVTAEAAGHVITDPPDVPAAQVDDSEMKPSSEHVLTPAQLESLLHEPADSVILYHRCGKKSLSERRGLVRYGSSSKVQNFATDKVTDPPRGQLFLPDGQSEPLVLYKTSQGIKWRFPTKIPLAFNDLVLLRGVDDQNATLRMQVVRDDAAVARVWKYFDLKARRTKKSEDGEQPKHEEVAEVGEHKAQAHAGTDGGHCGQANKVDVDAREDDEAYADAVENEGANEAQIRSENGSGQGVQSGGKRQVTNGNGQPTAVDGAQRLHKKQKSQAKTQPQQESHTVRLSRSELEPVVQLLHEAGSLSLPRLSVEATRVMQALHSCGTTERLLEVEASWVQFLRQPHQTVVLALAGVGGDPGEVVELYEAFAYAELRKVMMSAKLCGFDKAATEAAHVLQRLNVKRLLD